MANSANITPLQTHHDGASLLEIRFTRRCRELLVHADLGRTYLARFIRDGGTEVVYGLTLEQAEALQSALGQLRNDAVHYDKRAFTALERELKRVLFSERTKGLLPDPELDVSNVFMTYLLATTSSPARLNVGDRAIEHHVGEVTIIEPYGFHKLRCSDGRFYDKHGDRIDYRWGYPVRVAGGDGSIAGEYIARVSDLFNADGRPTYLQLVQGDDAASSIDGGIHG
jgi:hypothetical protein